MGSRCWRGSDADGYVCAAADTSECAGETASRGRILTETIRFAPHRCHTGRAGGGLVVVGSPPAHLRALVSFDDMVASELVTSTSAI